MRPSPGCFRLSDHTPIVLDPAGGDADFRSARRLQARVLERTGIRLPIETHADPSGLGTHIRLHREGASGEAYRIEIRETDVELRGRGPAGLRYAVETLGQIVDRRGRLPCGHVDDAPSFPYRGLLLDVSRGRVPTEATLRDLVDRCVALKLNVLMLYVEHTFRFRRHPEIGAGAGPLEAETLRELDAYAADRHVELVPCLQSLGHMEHVLRLPRYAPLAETNRRWTLAPVDPGSIALLRDLYGEFLPNFRSPRFHANCDEPYDLGKGRSAARAAEIGRGGLFLEHVRRVQELAAAHGKRTLIWGDVVHEHPEQIPDIPRDLVLLDWGYEADHDTERARAFADHGLEFWVCPGTASWNALFPRMDTALQNIARWGDAGRRFGARGLLLTDWGDFGHYNLLGNSWLAYASAAQEAWSGPADPGRFDRAFGRWLLGEASPVAAHLYRELGRWHAAGFEVANASPVQFLYFDGLDRSYFVRGVRPGIARRTRKRLERARERLARAAERFARDPLTHAELELAADASILALGKAEAGHAYVAWRRRPSSLDARSRRALARELDRLAESQRALGRRLRRLWLARSRPEGFAPTRRRLARSVRELRQAADRLRRGRATPLPEAHEGYAPSAVLAELRRATGL